LTKIKRLSTEVSDKIAAGEVVERPVSVVKELVENSIDASSGKINVRITNGGKSIVRVDDDGEGIPFEELPLAAENFTTNKISEIEDIYKVSTLGFRGEALASIRAVSRLRIISRSRYEEMGRKIQWVGGKIKSDNPCARNEGTEVEVEDLFYNLPARRKFMSSSRAEK
jgi:DNA mismatch repair protein MutL